MVVINQIKQLEVLNQVQHINKGKKGNVFSDQLENQW